MNNDKTNFTVRVYLTNGEKLCFRSAVSAGKIFNLGSEIENSLEANYLGMDMNGKLTIIPFQHILKIEIEPTPDVLISHVIRNIEAVKE